MASTRKQRSCRYPKHRQPLGGSLVARRLRLESLECRNLLSVTLGLTAVSQTGDSNFTTGGLITLQATLRDGTNLLPGTSIQVNVTAPGAGGPIAAVTLFDDGMHGDGAANDGVYANVFRRAVWTGDYQFQAVASGRDLAAVPLNPSPTATVALHVAAGLDSDGDGMPDIWETREGTNPLVNDAGIDLDGDGLTDLQEYFLGTRPVFADSDGDGYRDDVEVKQNTDPLTRDNLPHVLTVSPVDGGPDVSPSASLVIGFDQPVDVSTLSQATIVVVGTQGRHSTRYSGTVTYDATSMTATFHPDQSFADGDSVMAEVTTGVRSAAGNQLPSNYYWQFQVRQPAEPKPVDPVSGLAIPHVLGVSPVAGAPEVATMASIRIDFDNPIDVLTLSQSTIVPRAEIFN